MKIGVLIDNLGASQLAYDFIRQGNRALQEGLVEDLICFYINLAKPCIPMNFAAMQLCEAYGYGETLVATDLTTAEKLLEFPSASRKIFYVHDLEWTRMKQKEFSSLRRVYGSPVLELYARGADHQRLLESCFNRPVGLCRDFDLKAFLGAVDADGG